MILFSDPVANVPPFFVEHLISQLIYFHLLENGKSTSPARQLKMGNCENM